MTRGFRALSVFVPIYLIYAIRERESCFSDSSDADVLQHFTFKISFEDGYFMDSVLGVSNEDK